MFALRALDVHTPFGRVKFGLQNLNVGSSSLLAQFQVRERLSSVREEYARFFHTHVHIPVMSVEHAHFVRLVSSSYIICVSVFNETNFCHLARLRPARSLACSPNALDDDVDNRSFRSGELLGQSACGKRLFTSNLFCLNLTKFLD